MVVSFSRAKVKGATDTHLSRSAPVQGVAFAPRLTKRRRRLVLPNTLGDVWATAQSSFTSQNFGNVRFISAAKHASQGSEYARFSNVIERHTPTYSRRAQACSHRTVERPSS